MQKGTIFYVYAQWKKSADFSSYFSKKTSCKIYISMLRFQFYDGVKIFTNSYKYCQSAEFMFVKYFLAVNKGLKVQTCFLK